MKFNFKKITSVIACGALLGSTLGFAAAVNYPAPFVTGGAADVAIVYGSNPATSATDISAAATIGASLTPLITSTGATTLGEGDKVKFETSNDKFNIGNNFTAFYTTIDNEDFAIVLKDGTYWNGVNEDYDYEQAIKMGSEALSFFADSSFNNKKPVIGFSMDTSDHLLNYTLTFTPDVAEGGTSFANLDNTEIEMLGKKFFISNAESTANGVKLTLLDVANMVNVVEGTPQTITVGENTYEVSIDWVDSTDVRLQVGDELTNSLSVGETFKLKSGAYVGIKEINYNAKESGVSKVQFSIGMGKVTLENNQEVKVNDLSIGTIEDANGYTSVIKTYISNSSTDISKIVLEWNLDDDAWVAPGTELSMPGFNAIKLSMTGFNAPAQEKTLLRDNGNSAEIVTEVKEGALTLPILYMDASTETYIEGLGEDTDHRLVTNSTANPIFALNETQNSYFVVTRLDGDSGETYAYEIGGIEDASGKNKTTLNSIVTGGADIVFSEVGDTDDKGAITFTLLSASDTIKTARVKATTSSGTVYGNLILSKEGLTMNLPFANLTTLTAANADGSIDLIAANATAWLQNFTEEDKDGDLYTSASPDKSFTMTWSVDANDGMEPTATSLSELQEEKSSDLYDAMVSSDLATKVKLNKPSTGLGDAEIIYAGEESYADVYLAEVGAVSMTTNTVTTITDAEAATSSANLIVVGGSCINTVAADLLGGALCGSDFSAATNVGAGEFLIKTFTKAGKLATLVAGYDAADTVNAANALVNNKPEITVGKGFKGTTADTLNAM